MCHLCLQVKNVLAEFKKQCESNRELGCASALHYEIKAQVCITVTYPPHGTHTSCNLHSVQVFLCVLTLHSAQPLAWACTDSRIAVFSS